MKAAPLIVTALLGAADHTALDRQRRAHFPADRNLLPAHLTLFHHFPPSIGEELRHRLAAATLHQPAPPARLIGVRNLGRGVAWRVASDGLAELRATLADAFAACLTPADLAPWWPHITIQNKVDPAVANALCAALAMGFHSRPLIIAGLATWRYRGGSWEPLSRHLFSQSGRSRRS